MCEGKRGRGERGLCVRAKGRGRERECVCVRKRESMAEVERIERF